MWISHFNTGVPCEKTRLNPTSVGLMQPRPVTYDQFASRLAANDHGDTTWPPYGGGLPPLPEHQPPPPRRSTNDRRA